MGFANPFAGQRSGADLPCRSHVFLSVLLLAISAALIVETVKNLYATKCALCCLSQSQTKQKKRIKDQAGKGFLPPTFID